MDYIERRVWSFCWNPDEDNQGELYIHPNTTFEAFKTSSINTLSFYQNGLSGPALVTEIEIFAAHLNRFLADFGVVPTKSPAIARGAVRSVVSDTTRSMQDLLNSVTSNYREQ